MRLLGVLVLAALTATGLRTVHFGAPPPDFEVTARPAPLMLSQLRGRPVVINFWATWCPPCTNELPYFQKLQSEYGSRVRLVMIDWDERPDVAQGYLHNHGYDFPVVSDNDGKIYSAYSLQKIPDTIVVDATGDVTYVSLGGLSWEELAGAVDPLVSSKKSAITQFGCECAGYTILDRGQRSQQDSQPKNQEPQAAR